MLSLLVVAGAAGCVVAVGFVGASAAGIEAMIGNKIPKVSGASVPVVAICMIKASSLAVAVLLLSGLSFTRLLNVDTNPESVAGAFY